MPGQEVWNPDVVGMTSWVLCTHVQINPHKIMAWKTLLETSHNISYVAFKEIDSYDHYVDKYIENMDLH